MILLDTQTFLWLRVDPSRFAPHAMRSLQSTATVLVSAVTRAELEIKRLTGKLDYPAGILDDLGAAGLTPLPLTDRHSAHLAQLPGSVVRHDPFDRLLLAQAAVEGAALLTADRRLLGLGLEWVVPAD